MQMLAVVVLVAQAAGLYPKHPGNDFHGDIVVTKAGFSYKGVIQYDATGRRWMQYLDDLEETTVVVQPPGRSVTYTYIVVPTQPNPSCSCTTTSSAVIDDPWYYYMTGTSNGTSCEGGTTGKKGTLYDVGTSAYSNQARAASLCQADDGTVIYSSLDHVVREFTSVTFERLTEPFNTTALDGFLPQCGAGCSAPPDRAIPF